MFCSNCGRQLPDGTKFCNNCGAQLAEDKAEPKPEATPQKPEKAGKKKPNLVVILAVAACAFLLGKFVIAPSMTSDSGKENTPSQTVTPSQQKPSADKNNSGNTTSNAA